MENYEEYVVKYTQGNGYRCGCCRSSWEREETFNSLKEAFEFCAEIEFRKENAKGSEDDDVCVDEIFIRRPDTIWDWEESEVYKNKLASLKKEKSEKDEKAKIAKEKAAETRATNEAKKKALKDKEEYNRLKTKFEGE